MYKPRCRLKMQIPLGTSGTETAVIEPNVITAKWNKNNHKTADSLVVTIPDQLGGIHPRLLKYATCVFWMWDANAGDLDEVKHIRFTGITEKVDRELRGDSWIVTVTFYDYTTLFLANKPLCTEGMPEWSDTLKTIWQRICDNTGSWDPENKKVISTVRALRDHISFEELPEAASRPLSEIMHSRYHAISKPTPPAGSSSWDVWQWIVVSLGLISFIDKDFCYVTSTTEHYKSTNAARAIYGQNLHSLSEKIDNTITNKGILLISFNHLIGQVIESYYPPPGDPRIKTKRAAARPKSEAGSNITANEVSGQYENHTRYDIQDQAALDRAAKQAYEERRRQEIQGSFSTSEMRLDGWDGEMVDVLELRAGDAIRVEVAEGVHESLLGIKTGEADQVRYLTSTLNYDEGLAQLIVRNMQSPELATTVFHVKELTVDVGPESFNIEVQYHNLILVNE